MYVHLNNSMGTLDTITGEFEELVTLDRSLTDIAFSPDGELFGINFNTLFRVSLVSGETTSLGPHDMSLGNSLTFDSDGTLYGMGSSDELTQLSPFGGLSNVLFDTGFNPEGDIAFNQGQLFLSADGPLGVFESQFVNIDIAGSSASLVGSLDLRNVNAMATGPDGVLYAAGVTSLVSVDIATGETELAADFSGQDLISPLGAAFFQESGAPASLLATAVLPTSRSVAGEVASAFLTVINAGEVTAEGCTISPRTSFSGSFEFQATDPLTNAPVGLPDTPVDIPVGSQSFIVFLDPFFAFEPINFEFNVGCENTELATVTPGLNTLLLSSSGDPVPDIVALVATASGDGALQLDATNNGAFALATVNVGATDTLRVTLDSGAANETPSALFVCETNPDGTCVQPPAPTLSLSIPAGDTPTFAIFVAATTPIANRPDLNRVFVRFRDQTGAIRGSTSVAVRTQ